MRLKFDIVQLVKLPAISNACIATLVLCLFIISVNPVVAKSVQSAVNMKNDTLTEVAGEDLPLVEITAFESERPVLLQAVALERIGESDFEAFGSRSLAPVVNSKAGVRLEQRAPSSYRVSIRGSSLRSPFGVRNVKVYWNGLPLTLADGTSAMNILDMASIGSLQILKGPTGSIYGAGNGGVIKMESSLPDEGSTLEADIGGGSFNMFRAGLRKTSAAGDVHYSTGLYHFRSDGHREHSRTERTVFNLSARWFPSADQPIGFHFMYSDLFYEIPGGLNREQFLSDPMQSRPGSIEQNSSIRQKTILAGITSERNFTKNLSNKTAVYIHNTDFDHPFILDYKKELGTDVGGRTVFQKDIQIGDIPLRLISGAEFQQGRQSGRNFGNVRGVRDTLRFADDITARQYFFFKQIEVEPRSDWLLTFGLSRNKVAYNVDRNFDAIIGHPFTVSRKFRAEWVPRVAASKKLNNFSSVFASVSAGFSPPTLDEFRTNEGSVNEGLDSERGLNVEAGYRGLIRGEGVQWDLTGFYYRLSQSISTFTNEDGVVLFRNSGATDQYGIEASAQYPIYRYAGGNPLTGIFLRHAYTGHFFYFQDRRAGEEDISGNYLTGVAPHSVFNELKLELFGNMDFYLHHRYSDRLPLNDENTVFQSSWNVFGLRIHWKVPTGFLQELKLSAGVDNVFDTTYSLGNDLNAFGGRYYQTAAGRNWDFRMQIVL